MLPWFFGGLFVAATMMYNSMAGNSEDEMGSHYRSRRRVIARNRFPPFRKQWPLISENLFKLLMVEETGTETCWVVNTLPADGLVLHVIGDLQAQCWLSSVSVRIQDQHLKKKTKKNNYDIMRTSFISNPKKNVKNFWFQNAFRHDVQFQYMS